MLEWLHRIVFAAVLLVGLGFAIARLRTARDRPSWAVRLATARAIALGRRGPAPCIALWCGILLGLNVLRLFVRGVIPDALPLPTTGLVMGSFLLLKDLAQALVLIVAGAAAPANWRRRILRHVPLAPPSLVLWLGILAASGLVYDAGTLAMHRVDAAYRAEAAWEPFSSRLALAMLVGIGPIASSLASHLAWWVHNVTALVIANRIAAQGSEEYTESVPTTSN